MNFSLPGHPVITRVFNGVILLLFTFVIVGRAATQQFANIGDLKLESGQTIRNCTIGYRTFGTINSDRSNVVVLLMWAGGKTSQLHLEPTDKDKFVDTSKYFVVAIDPLSNGVSSSPSNSKEQPRMSFPEYSMSDLVSTQYKLLTEQLRITHVRAIVGTSMGGMQTFQWMVSYPTFADLAVPVVGSPQLAPYDLVHWQAQMDAITNDKAWNNGNYTENPARSAEYEFGAILLTSPENFNRTMTREKVIAALANSAKVTSAGFDANNKLRQVHAMMSIDVTQKFGGSWERAASAVKAKTLVIVSKFDHTVTPGPAEKFAKLLGSKTVLLTGDCGHSASFCEGETVNAAIADFLN